MGNGDILRVASIREHPEKEQDVVVLQTDDAWVRVTACHRIMVQRGDQQIAIPAEALHNDDVVSSRCVQKLTKKRCQKETTKTFEVKFNPDKSVETFMLPSNPILTRGQQDKKNRRSGMNKLSIRDKVPNDNLSIPDTMSVWS